ncbi:MAG: hypothetical protein NZ561_10125, partial [Phycisphaerae bacterium]|nr:hypothetical protein [Phycisphaerae bacterium]
MRAPLNRSARRVIAGTICGMLPLIAGCDSPAHQADRKARAETETAETLLITGEDPSRALELLTSAAGNTEAAPATRLRANALLGQVLMEDARKIAWSVDRLMRDSQRLSMEIAQLCGQTQFAAQLARGYQKLDPTPIVNNLSKQAEDARGGADRLIWFEANGMRFETVAAAAQEISRLEGEIARLQEQIRSLEAQRDAALTSAEKAALEAESARGREAVEAFIRASNARKQAADLAVQIDLQQAALRPLQKNLAIVVARKEYISAAAKALEDQGSAMQNSWLTIQKAAAAQQALIRTITTGTEPGEAVTLSLPEGVQVSIDSLPAGSIAQKASKLAEIDRLAEAQRAVALEKLNSAVKHLADAVIAADIARKDVELAKAEHPGAAAGQVKAWESSRNTLSAATYRVQQAAALQLLAELHASHAAALDLRRKLQALVAAALAGTGVEPPSVLADPQPVQDQWQQAADAADEAYRSADE